MANRDLVVIGASAGGTEATKQLLHSLPATLDAAVLIVIHTSNHVGSMLPQVLQRASRLPVVQPTDWTRIEKGTVYIAPADRHMIVEGDLLRIIQGPRENLHRPAIDPLFRSAASSYGRRVIGIILSGSLDDGTAGLMLVRARGGQAIVQDPDDAMFSPMPQNALKQVPDAVVLALEEIPDEVARMSREEIPDEAPAKQPQDSQPVKETKIAEFDMQEIENENRPGHPSAFACPDCGGVLWEIEGNGFLRFRCRVGHAFTARHLGAEQRHAIETALWSALRALEESASLYRRMAERANHSSYDRTAEQFEERAGNTTTNARVLREFLIRVNQQEEDRFAAEET